MNGINIDYWWPMLHFGPVNLWTVMPAAMFYASHEEQVEMIWHEYDCQNVHIAGSVVINSPVLGQVATLIAPR